MVPEQNISKLKFGVRKTTGEVVQVYMSSVECSANWASKFGVKKQLRTSYWLVFTRPVDSSSIWPQSHLLASCKLVITFNSEKFARWKTSIKWTIRCNERVYFYFATDSSIERIFFWICVNAAIICLDSRYLPIEIAISIYILLYS